MNDFSIITGPGSHSHLLIRALQEGYKIDFTRYWPRYEYVSDQGKELSRFFDFSSYLLYGLQNKFRFLNDSKWHQDILFPLYDKINSDRITGKNLIAWPQVSLTTMRKIKANKGRLILEQPMIHVDAWNKLADQEYAHLRIKNNARFSSAMTTRMKKEYDLADHIVVHSEFSKKTFIDHGVTMDKLSVCSLGLETQPQIDKWSYGKDLQIVYVGRVEVLKGVHYLLNAFKAISDQAKLHIVGHVDKNLKSRLAMPINNVTYYGQLSKKSLTQIYAQADVLVFPSLYDGFGMVILEAMSHGVPVIASKNSAGPDIIKDFETGFVVEPRNSNELTERLQWMIQHRDNVLLMGQAAQQLIERAYSFARYRERILKIITQQFGPKLN